MARKAHWGRWITDRSRFVGFKRQLDFARRVGCSPQNLRRWVAMESPPERMRRGLDYSLSRALETTPQMLFHDWKSITPEAAARVGFMPEEMSIWAVTEKADLLEAQTVLREAAAHMLPGEVEKVAEYALQLVLAKNDFRREQFMQYLTKLRDAEAELYRRIRDAGGAGKARHKSTPAMSKQPS